MIMVPTQDFKLPRQVGIENMPTVEFPFFVSVNKKVGIVIVST